MDQLTRTQIAVAVAAVVTAIGATAKVRLFTNDPTITDNNVPGDYVEPSGAWYTPSDVGFPKPVYGEPYIQADGSVGVKAASVQHNFATGMGVLPATIKGWFVTNTDGSTVYHSAYLPAPVTLSSDLDSVISTPGFALKSVA